MQNYYQPENVFNGEDRWLHTVPSGKDNYSLAWRDSVMYLTFCSCEEAEFEG